MRNSLIGCVTAALLAFASVAPASAAVFNFAFDSSPDSTVTAPLVGSGTFSFDGTATAGTVALTSLTNYAFSFTFGSNTFTNADIQTPVANVQVQFTTQGTDLVVNFGGSRGGPFGGSLDFTNGGAFLTFQPNFGGLYGSGNFFGNYAGVAAAEPSTGVPTPMALGLFGLGLAGLAVVRRRRA
jgi:MYXO-CTERM domain-containing protein